MPKSQLTTLALVLRTRDFRDRDRFVTLLTPDLGKVDVLAKGIRMPKSRRQSAVQPGMLIRCNWITTHGHHTLTEAMLEESLMQSSAKLERLRDFLAVLEVIDAMALEAIEQNELFENSVHILRTVGKDTEYHRGWVRQKLIELAEMQGVEIEEDSATLSVGDIFQSALGRKLRAFEFLRV